MEESSWLYKRNMYMNNVNRKILALCLGPLQIFIFSSCIDLFSGSKTNSIDSFLYTLRYWQYPFDDRNCSIRNVRR